jgi:hypothetical protein
VISWQRRGPSVSGQREEYEEKSSSTVAALFKRHAPLNPDI